MTINPFQSPAAVPAEARMKAGTGLPTAFYKVVSGLLMAVGGLFLLLLNGQVFTNAIVFLSLWAVSILLWLPQARPSKPKSREARLVIMLHLVLMIVVASTLSSSYAAQQGFNEEVERIRKMQRASDVRRSEVFGVIEPRKFFEGRSSFCGSWTFASGSNDYGRSFDRHFALE